MSRWILVMLVMVGTVGLVGCWDYRPLDENFMITAIGIDEVSSDPSQLDVTIFGVAYQDQDLSLHAEGKTVTDALVKIQEKSEKNLALSHVQVILISKEMAKKGITPYLDVFFRDSQLRNNAIITVVEGRTSGYLKKREPFAINGKSFLALLETSQPEFDHTSFHLQSIGMGLYTNTSGFVLPLLEMDEEQQVMSFKGLSLFQKDRWVIDLDQQQLIGYLLLARSLKKADLTIGSMNLNRTTTPSYSIRFSPSNYHIRVGSNSDQLTFIYKIQVRDAVIELNPLPIKGIPLERKIKMQEEVATELKRLVDDVLSIVQTKFQIEPFGLQEHARIYWHPFNQEKWNVQFSKAKMNVEIDVEIERFGQTI